MIQKIRQMRAETKYSTMSIVPTLAVLLLHSIHWLSAPLMLGAMEMHAHHPGMSMSSSVPISFLTLTFFVLNGAGIFFAVRLLWTAWRVRRKGWPCYVYSLISTASLGIGIFSLITL